MDYGNRDLIDFTFGFEDSEEGFRFFYEIVKGNSTHLSSEVTLSE